MMEPMTTTAPAEPTPTTSSDSTTALAVVLVASAPIVPLVFWIGEFGNRPAPLTDHELSTMRDARVAASDERVQRFDPMD